MQRMGMVIGIKPDHVGEYRRLHADAWPEILAGLSTANIRNYSIYLREPENLLFGYWEYAGTDFAADMAKIGAEEVTQRWWALCMPCQSPLESRVDGGWWATMEEVFHHD